MAQNPLYNILGGNPKQNRLNGLARQIEALKRQFGGDPKEQIQRMLNSGDIREMAMSLGEMMGDLPDELKGDAERFMRKLDSIM